MTLVRTTTDPLPPTAGAHQMPHFAFVDADNMRRSFHDALIRHGIGKEDLELFDFSGIFSFNHHDRIYFYSAVDENEDLPKWLGDIRSAKGCVLKLGALTQKGNRTKQEGVDVKLAIDATRLAFTRTMRTCTLYGADGDFIPLVEALSEAGCIVNVVSFNNPSKGRVAPKLQAECDFYQWLGGYIIHRTLSGKLPSISKRMSHFHAYLDAPERDKLFVHDSEIPIKKLGEEYYVMAGEPSPSNVYASLDPKALEIWLQLCFRLEENLRP